MSKYATDEDTRAALEELYGAKVPRDCNISMCTDIGNRRHLAKLYNESNPVVFTDANGQEIIIRDEVPKDRGHVRLLNDEIKQSDNAFYGNDFEDNTFYLLGREQEEQVVCEGLDDEGNPTYYTAGKKRNWIEPTAIKPLLVA